MASQPEARTTPPWLLPAVVVALIALAGLVAFVLTSRPAAQPVAPVAPQPAPTVAAAQADPAAAQADPAVPPDHGSLDPNGPAVAEIAVTEARTLFDAGSAIFIDVRT